mmetsp:Transcript_13244/g.23542  ORF Transcript_13244/g.23542 Transcript_13244/m.23542 type:complete len:522 (-) Transcript_13244:149-1714(-)|eukprot:CAMPEP_0194564412 /NCGR_PEP_ID=MMETSP0292-20121207/4079_1 /TAXON_ID=39354 /ORGANISM="Heterosigma akashiwo, Strain CCMP2393" /LENGTH=521 /DNA_ID=CAMNT_0039413539 /DNA_START=263 /DNA_END=1828 /DNA_ORIENTATION=-
MDVSPWTQQDDDILLADSDLDTEMLTLKHQGSSLLSEGGDGISYVSGAHSVIPPDIDLSKFQGWAQRNFWSRHHRIWNEYVVHKARLPNADDSAQTWHEKYYPESLDDFLEVPANQAATDHLNMLLEEKEIKNLIVQGKQSSGKTALIMVYLREHYAALGLEGDPVAAGAVEVVSERESRSASRGALEARARALAARKVRRSGGVKALVVEGADQMPPKVQQSLRKSMDDFEPKLRFLFTCAEPKKLVANIKQRCETIKMKRITEEQTIRFILHCVTSENVGFEREGLEEIYKKFEPDIKAILNGIQQVFMRQQYVSYINVCKEISIEKLEGLLKARVSDRAALAPAPRCAVCTLPPPCGHAPNRPDDLATRGARRRAELPQRDGMNCQDFLKTGACKVFNRMGHCSLHHPLDKHLIMETIQRCPKCTLPIPCHHCRYYMEKEKLKGYAFVSKKDVERRKPCLAPEEYAAVLEKIGQVVSWLKNTKSVEEKDYINKYSWLYGYCNDIMTRFPVVPDHQAFK